MGAREEVRFAWTDESVYYQAGNRNAMPVHGHGCRLF